MHQAFDVPADSAFVLGLLADLERHEGRLQAQLAKHRTQAQPHDAAFDQIQALWRQQTQELRGVQTGVNRAARGLGEANAQCATLLQELGNLRRRSDELRGRMQALNADSDAYRQLRRARASLGVQAEDREKSLAAQQSLAKLARDNLEAAHLASLGLRDAARLTSVQLRRLQALQPPAAAHLELFACSAAKAHALLFLEAYDAGGLGPNGRHSGGQPPQLTAAQAIKRAWKARLLAAIEHIVGLYRGLAAGRYAVETATSWAGGRSVAVSESLYAMVALGELEGAIDLFSLSSANDAFFHHIYEPFRGGCLGLFLVGRHSELAEALRLHQDAQGVRGAYVQAYYGLLHADQASFHDALAAIALFEWRQWRSSASAGLGLVNVAVLGLAELSRLRGFAMPTHFGPTVPWPVQPR